MKYQWLLIFTLVEDNYLPILRSQYHGSRWPGDVRNQGISSYDTDLVYWG